MNPETHATIVSVVAGIASSLDEHHAGVALSAIADELSYLPDPQLETFVRAIREYRARTPWPKAGTSTIVVPWMAPLADELTERLLGGRTVSDYPVIDLPGSEGWRNAYDLADQLGAIFPAQDAWNFCHALEYNDRGPLADHKLTGLLLIEQGERDHSPWVWLVSVDDGSTWVARGWCDYTGWDCQSGVSWQPFDETTTEDA